MELSEVLFCHSNEYFGVVLLTEELTKYRSDLPPSCNTAGWEIFCIRTLALFNLTTKGIDGALPKKAPSDGAAL